MTFKLSLTGSAASFLRMGFVVLALSLSCTGWAQPAQDNPDWKESALPSPPAFDFGKLITFSGATGSSLVYGVDPASVTISRGDGLIRYVLVATGTSGARNVMYEAIRCATGEFKTYARHATDGRWNMLANAEWRPMLDNIPSKHALYFARAGACDGGSAPQSVNVLVNQLKNTNYRLGN
ncbi:MAG: CNP1-like family protein [Polaromonas sp.]|nr:CNP1-like family protein [Polaromonas sp.]